MGQPRVNVQPGDRRNKNFQEVSLGYSKSISREEARRCPQCADPVCQRACPLGIDIPGFIRLLREGHVAGAYERILEQNALPSVCGRICSAPCEAACVLNEEDAPIGIRALERYASDSGRLPKRKQKARHVSSKKVAVIGAGPAGLTAAAEFARRGLHVTLFEAMDQPGGVLRYGIPEFRMPKAVLDTEIEYIVQLGVDVQTHIHFGQACTLSDLKKQGYAAILLALGAGVPQCLDIPGSHLGGVYHAEEFLMRLHHHLATQKTVKADPVMLGQKIAVIGSGNTALDCARSLKRLGKEVRLIFRRSEGDMRVSSQERAFGKEEGVIYEPFVKLAEMTANHLGYVEALKCIRMDYADEKNTGVWQLIPVEGSEFVIPVDSVILATGHQPNTHFQRLYPEIVLNDNGSIRVDQQTFQTSVPGVFACGNVVTNAGPVIDAMGAAKRCVPFIETYIR